MLLPLRAVVVILAAALASATALACTPEDFSKAVDQAGADLRDFNLASVPRLQARLAELKAKKGWSDDSEELALDYLADARLTGFDESANHLLDHIDTLGRVEPGSKPDCAKLDELKAATVELLAVMKAKAAYTMAKLDKELGPVAAKAPPRAAAESKTTAESKVAAEGKPAAAESKPAGAARPAAPPAARTAATEPAKPAQPKPAPPPKAGAAPWSTKTEVDVAAAPPPPPAPPAPDAKELPAGALVEPAEGYTIDEIKEVTRGVFGAVSTNLASVLEYAFSSFGRPSAYVLGKEGGGAFLAGVRYGSGTLYLRFGGTRPVHWHGPSLGYDVGVAGSRTLFLIYGLKDPELIYRTYTGLDGSAYVVGGIGLTVLKGGPVIMAPIRSGVGLRVGANLGYIRFTRHKSWNPF